MHRGSTGKTRVGGDRHAQVNAQHALRHQRKNAIYSVAGTYAAIEQLAAAGVHQVADNANAV